MVKTLVMEPNFFIAEDITEIALGMLPDSEIRVASTLEEAIEALTPAGDWDVVIANEKLLQAPQKVLNSFLTNAKGLKILLESGPSPSDQMPKGWHSVRVPFNDRMLRDALGHWKG